MVHLLAQMMGSQSLKIPRPLYQPRTKKAIPRKEIWRNFTGNAPHERPGLSAYCVTLDELMDNVFEGKSAVIENLLYTGAYILAGTPKIGKSFLVAQIAHHVSTGQDLWGYKVHQGTVLYLALENDESRLQRRMFRMFGVEGTSSLHFATNAKMIGSGLDEQLEKFIREHSDTKLIIVDTLQKVREVVNDSYSYSSDYEVIGKLKQFADRYGVCVLIVHHTRKQPAGDSFEMISGTTGLLGGQMVRS